MSKTDKTDPYWVKVRMPEWGGRIEHNHIEGVCREEPLSGGARGASPRGRYWHIRRCGRFEQETLYCDDKCMTWESQRWWMRKALGEEMLTPPPVCRGHIRFYLAHPDMPCSVCDAPPKPTCVYSWGDLPYRIQVHWCGGASLGRATKRLATKRRRQRSRAALRVAQREWNTWGETDTEPDRDIPFEPSWW